MKDCRILLGLFHCRKFLLALFLDFLLRLFEIGMFLQFFVGVVARLLATCQFFLFFYTKCDKLFFLILRCVC